MPFLIDADQIRFQGAISVHEGEALLEWLVEHPDGKIDLKDCEHMHVAILQTLMANPRELMAPPTDPLLSRVIGAALASGKEGVR